MMLRHPDCTWNQIKKMTEDPGVHPCEVLNLARQTCERALDRSKQILSRLASRYDSLVARLQLLQDSPRRRRTKTVALSFHLSQLIGYQSETGQLFDFHPIQLDLEIAGRLSVTAYDTAEQREQLIQASRGHPAALINELKHENVMCLGLGLYWKRHHMFLEQQLKLMLESGGTGIQEIRAKIGRMAHGPPAEVRRIMSRCTPPE
jgi:hypothetical protein